jgi:hypothetical protein
VTVAGEEAAGDEEAMGGDCRGPADARRDMGGALGAALWGERDARGVEAGGATKPWVRSREALEGAK